MKPSLILIILGILFFYSCNRRSNTHKNEIDSCANILPKDSNKKEDWLTKTLKSIPTNLKLVFGHRFIIQGDFDGDGLKEILQEHYFSCKENKETNKFYDSLDYDQLAALTIDKDPISYATFNKRIDTLWIADGQGQYAPAYCGGQLLGLSYMKNEGDLDGDGGDEISYVINWADWSSINSCHLVSYKKKKWKQLYSFEIRDWQLPGLPEVQNEYYLFGVSGVVSTIGNDTINERLKKELDSFPGFIKKLKNGKIQVKEFILNAESDSMPIIDLKQLKKKKND